ncbi:MAG: amidohydrolase family protein [Clostridia bacterium]|nr:amidohydrolase family protein [Clostridia bacterium]
MNIVIKNGTILDPKTKTMREGDIYVRDGVFCEPKEHYGQATEQIDATGCIVTAGLIDAHMHAFHADFPYGTNADMMCPPSGVTTVIDQGSGGVYNMDMCLNTTELSTVTIKALLQPSMYGVQPAPYGEIQDPMYVTHERVWELFSKYHDRIIGLKLRTGGGLSCGFGLSTLKEIKKMQKELRSRGYRCNVTVHFGPLDEGITVGDILSHLEKGDVFTHVFRGDSTIFAPDGSVLPEVLEARKRGVIFDTAASVVNMTINCAKQGISQGFLPDIISTDMVRPTQYKRRLGSLIHQASMFLNMGMELPDVIRAVTYTPALTYGITSEAGTLDIGAPGDVAVIKAVPHKLTFADSFGGEVKADKMLVPQLTVKAGHIIYRDALMY